MTLKRKALGNQRWNFNWSKNFNRGTNYKLEKNLLYTLYLWKYNELSDCLRIKSINNCCFKLDCVTERTSMNIHFFRFCKFNLHLQTNIKVKIFEIWKNERKSWVDREEKRTGIRRFVYHFASRVKLVGKRHFDTRQSAPIQNWQQRVNNVSSHGKCETQLRETWRALKSQTVWKRQRSKEA